MSVPAITRVRAALFAVLAATPALNWFDGRSDDEPIDESERPAGVLRFTEVAFETGQGGGLVMHTAAFEIDLFAGGNSFNDIDGANAVAMSDVNAAIQADDTLGGLCAYCNLTGMTGSAESQPDVGAITLTGELMFFTPENDFNTVMGANGPIT